MEFARTSSNEVDSFSDMGFGRKRDLLSKPWCKSLFNTFANFAYHVATSESSDREKPIKVKASDITKSAERTHDSRLLPYSLDPLPPREEIEGYGPTTSKEEVIQKSIVSLVRFALSIQCPMFIRFPGGRLWSEIVEIFLMTWLKIVAFVNVKTKTNPKSAKCCCDSKKLI